MAMTLMMITFFLLALVRSVAKEMMFCNTAMTVEKDAKHMNRKNKEPQSLPPGMLLNTLGSVTKIREDDHTSHERYEGVQNGDEDGFPCQRTGFVDVTAEDGNGTDTDTQCEERLT